MELPAFPGGSGKPGFRPTPTTKGFSFIIIQKEPRFQKCGLTSRGKQTNMLMLAFFQRIPVGSGVCEVHMPWI